MGGADRPRTRSTARCLACSSSVCRWRPSSEAAAAASQWAGGAGTLINPASRNFCAACDSPLFRTSEKVEAGAGWPSFWAPTADEALELKIPVVPVLVVGTDDRLCQGALAVPLPEAPARAST